MECCTKGRHVRNRCHHGYMASTLLSKNAMMFDYPPVRHPASQLAKLANRKNTVNGRIYKNDPTIFSLELCNECQ
jgi:hypothetical protein